jgi:hypothetical protein
MTFRFLGWKSLRDPGLRSADVGWWVGEGLWGSVNYIDFCLRGVACVLWIAYYFEGFILRFFWGPNILPPSPLRDPPEGSGSLWLQGSLGRWKASWRVRRGGWACPVDGIGIPMGSSRMGRDGDFDSPSGIDAPCSSGGVRLHGHGVRLFRRWLFGLGVNPLGYAAYTLP